MTSHKIKEVILNTAMSFGFGGMNVNELAFLYTFCRDRTVLELGSHIGQSGYVIAHSAKELTCVDAWQDDFAYLDDAQRAVYNSQPANIEKQFDVNTKGLGINKIKGFTTEVFTEDYYDIILIDADHSYEGVKKDINKYYTRCKYMLFHDYNQWEGVTRAVNELNLEIIDGINYLIVVRGGRYE